MTDAGLFDAGRQQVRRRYNLVGAALLILALITLIPAIISVQEWVDGPSSCPPPIRHSR